MKQEILRYSTTELFNNSTLQQYDKEGQKSFLAYLVKNQKMKIENNTLVFPNIYSEETLNENLIKYNRQIRMQELISEISGINDACIFGINRALSDKRKALKEMVLPRLNFI